MSASWKSQSFTLKQKWKAIDNNMRRMRLDRSPAVPRNIEEYTKHMSEWSKEEAIARDNKVVAMKADIEMKARVSRNPISLFDDKIFAGGRCGVLGFKTVWARRWTPEAGHDEVPWPDSQEFKEEGDERHTSNFRRYLPLLRRRGNDTVNWKQRPLQEQYLFDRVMLVPRLCSVVIPHLYGFELELDLNGIPYDDDELNGGEEAIAFHLDETGENVKNATLRKFEDFLEFQNLYSHQIYGTNESMRAADEKNKNHSGVSHDDLVSAQSTASTHAHGGQTRSFNFNPRACEFVSILNSPSPSEETSPVEYSPVTPATVSMDVYGIINQINSMSTAQHVNQAGSTSNVGRALILAQSGNATYAPNDDYESCMYGNAPAAVKQSGLYPSIGARRQGSHGAIGSERHSSEGTLTARDEYTNASSTYGDEDVDCISYRTAICHRNSENVSPRTIPTNSLAVMKIQSDDEEAEGPTSLSQLVDSSMPDGEDHVFY